MGSREEWDAVKRRLWDHILVQTYGTSDLSTLKELPPDPLGHAFFWAVEMAFATDDNVPISGELVKYMAAWSRSIARGDDERGGPFGEDHNHCIEWAFNGFLNSLIRAIEHGQVKCRDGGGVFYNAFPIPQWLVDMCMENVRERAERWNKDWDENPNSRPYIRSRCGKILLTAH